MLGHDRQLMLNGLELADGAAELRAVVAILQARSSESSRPSAARHAAPPPGRQTARRAARVIEP
ncbi:hypothetical protein, partial [Bordetella pertussis]|uniref:hypothetical protein n=1 Tax=Bordetella pertussis TaxID=520 RepID=UPI0021CB6D79